MSNSSGDIFNLNSEKNNETTTKEIVEKTIDKWKSDIKILVEESRFYESFKLRINSEKLTICLMGKQA